MKKAKKPKIPKLSPRTAKEWAKTVDIALAELVRELQNENPEIRLGARKALLRHVARKGRRSDESQKSYSKLSRKAKGQQGLVSADEALPAKPKPGPLSALRAGD